MMVLQNFAIKTLLSLAVLVAVFTIGYDLGGDRQKAKQLEAVVTSQTDSNKEVLASQAKSIEVQEQTAASSHKIEVIKDEVAKRIEPNEPKVITKIVTKYVGVPDDSSNTSSGMPNGETVIETSRPWTFDSGTVRLLNSARANDTDSTTDSSDGSDQAVTDITVGKFVESDLEVVSLYHDQSVRFKALQDYVKEKQDDGYMFCKPP